MISHALAFARRGLAVLPLAGKIPVTPNGLKDATFDINMVAQLWTRWPKANIGLLTGPKFWALDIDGAAGEASLRGLQALPDTVEIITGGGGRHLYFQAEPRVGNRAKFLPGLDVRGHGGFVVAPPSTHPNGRQYIWGPNCAALIAKAPDWLVEMVRRSACKVDLQPGTIPEGARNDTIARVAGKLLRQWGLDGDFVLDLVLAFNEARCEPPLPREEVKRTVESIARKEMARRSVLRDAPAP